MIKKTLVLRLLSDTLPGNGEGLAGIIDNDVCFDSYGLPNIPARRIKGILREVAVQLNCFAADTGITDEVMGDIFQGAGSSEEARFVLGNGYLRNHSSLISYLQYASDQTNLAKRFSPQSVLSLFSYTRSQTSLEDDTAKENTLRQSRVLKRGLEFVFDCRIDEELLPHLQQIIKLARSMGLNRTRGLGEIQLGLQDQTVNPVTTPFVTTRPGDSDTALLQLQIANKYPMLLSSESGKTQESQTYIPGSVILGACASQYIRAKKQANSSYNPDSDPEFISLFVDGSVSWGNGNLRVHNQMSRPIPLSWKKDKATGNIYNLANSVERQVADAAATNLKGIGVGYFVVNGPSFSLCSPNLNVEYHHRRPGDITKGSPDKGDGEFYQFEVIGEGQEFNSQIIGKVEDLKKIRNLLEQGELWLGKSRSAQYAYCTISSSISPVDSTLSLEKGDKLYLYLLSDTIIKNERGLSVVTIGHLQKEFISWWRKSIDPTVNTEQLVPKMEESFIAASRLGGFMSIWKLPKLQEPVYRAGSIISFEYKGQDIELKNIDAYHLGQETHRGFGRFQLQKEAEMNIAFAAISEVAHQDVPTMPNELIPLFRWAIEEEIKAKAIRDSQANLSEKIPSSLVRRIMAAVESGAQSPDSKAQSVLNNIQAIKRLKENKPSWIKHLEQLLEAVTYPDFLRALMQDTSPDRNLSTIETWLNLNEQDRDTWFPLLEKYCCHYLRNLALLLRKNKETANREVNNETAG